MAHETNHQDDPLDMLFEDREVLDRAILAQAILPYARLNSNGEIVLIEKWHELNLQRKILVYMLARKALRIKGLLNEDEEPVSSAKIEADTGITGNSVRPSMKKLVDMRFVKPTKGKESTYFVPDHAVIKVNKYLGGEE